METRQQKGNCLSMCLEHITWISNWEYSYDIPNKWKIDIQKLWYDRWYSICYHPEPIKTQHRNVGYIQIYNTERWTTHAVIENSRWFCIYNPHKIDDITTKSWMITIIKK
jgi:hypothetical protein